jgi:aminoglycoside N3'-acetyltransferase
MSNKKNFDFKKVKNKLKDSLDRLDFKKNDIVYLGVDLGQTFKNLQQEIFYDNTLNLEVLRKKCSEMIFQTLKDYFNKGTILCPAFNFDFFLKKKFNKYKTKSTLGYFENFFFKKKGVIRSNHPIFSISAYGRHKKALIQPCGPFSFGLNSPFNNFYKKNVYFLNLGIKFKDTCTYLHHLEHLNGVNHRYYKAISGNVFINRKYQKKTFFSLVRFKSLKSKKAEYKIENILKNKKLIKETEFNGIYLSKVSAIDVFNLTMNKLKKNPTFFMSKNTIVKID